MLSLSLKHHHRGSIAAAFTSAMPVVYGLAFNLVTLVIVLTCFNSWDLFFFTFFKSFQTLSFGVSIKHGRQSKEGRDPWIFKITAKKVLDNYYFQPVAVTTTGVYGKSTPS